MLHAIASFIATLGTAFVAWANLHTDEPTVVLAFALPVVVASSAMWPSAAPVFGLLVGAAVPISTFLACALGWHVPYPCTMTTVYQSCIVFALTLPAAGIGYLFGKALLPAAPVS
jgi:hypothetical protein